MASRKEASNVCEACRRCGSVANGSRGAGDRQERQQGEEALGQRLGSDGDPHVAKNKRHRDLRHDKIHWQLRRKENTGTVLNQNGYGRAKQGFGQLQPRFRPEPEIVYI